MSLHFRHLRAGHFRENYLLWVALSHFLPANLMSELAAELIAEASDGKLKFADLCEDKLSSGHPTLATWAVTFKPRMNGLAAYLQGAVRALAWQSDSVPSFDPEKLSPEDAKRARSLELAFELSKSDVSSVDTWIPGRPAIPSGLVALTSSMMVLNKAQDCIGTENIQEIFEISSGVVLPLRAVLLKHLGDLCADLDQPIPALSLYEKAGELCTLESQPAWKDFISSFRSIVLQSNAAMLRLTVGPSEAAESLSAFIRRPGFRSNPLPRTNAALDLMNAQIFASKGVSFPLDVRTALLRTPQLVASADLSNAFEYWDSKKFRDAHRRFWSALRRQTALGDATQSRETKAYYGRSILDELSSLVGSQRRPESFLLAMRLLIESGKAEIIQQHDWTDGLLRAYLNPEIARWIVDYSNRIPAAVQERQLAVISIAENWLLKISPDLEEVAVELIDLLAVFGRENVWSSISSSDIAQASFKALENVAKQRSEFCRLGSKSVTDAVLVKLAEGHFRARWGALDTALAFSEGLNASDLRRCIMAVLAVLSEIEPSDGAWPVIRPAIGLISSPEAQALWAEDRELGEKSAAVVLRFGLSSQSESTRLLFLLKDLGPYINRESEDWKELADVVLEMRNRTRQINSSAATGVIASLLAAPSVAGREGVKDAVSGIVAILNSALEGRSSISLGHAYGPIIQLYQEREQIARSLNFSEAEISDLMSEVIAPLEAFWSLAATKPLLFTGFAIPEPTTPNATLIHNWAFATLGFARSVDGGEALLRAVERAAQNPLLGPHIALARAVRLTAGDEEVFDPETIGDETREVFYAALGQRLVHLVTCKPPNRYEVLACLLEQALRHGPNGLDGSLLALAVGDGVAIDHKSPAIVAYANRLKNDRALSRSLMPLLRALARQDAA